MAPRNSEAREGSCAVTGSAMVAATSVPRSCVARVLGRLTAGPALSPRPGRVPGERQEDVVEGGAPEREVGGLDTGTVEPPDGIDQGFGAATADPQRHL